MKKLHSFAFCALLTPVITLGAGSVLAQQTTEQNPKQQTQSSPRDKNALQGTPETMQEGYNNQRQEAAGQYSKNKSGMQHSSYMDSAPFDGMQANELIGAEVKTIDDEDIGEVQDLVIDRDGQVVAIVVSVGGFLGMGDKNVAIGWDRVTKSGNADDKELVVTVSRDDLNTAPKFKKRDLISSN